MHTRTHSFPGKERSLDTYALLPVSQLCEFELCSWSRASVAHRLTDVIVAELGAELAPAAARQA